MPSLTPEQQEAWFQTRQPIIMGICILFLALGNLSVPMRIWAQWTIHKRPLAEDYSLVLALIFANVVTISTLVSAQYGLGLHIWRVNAQDPTYHSLVSIFSSIWLTAVFNGPALLATKISLLLYYRRLFLVHQSWLRIAWWFNLVFVVLWGIFCTLYYILQCTPPSYYWERKNPNNTIDDGKCPIPAKLENVAIPLILSALSDFAILLLPILTVLTLQTALIRKLGLAAIFSVGFLSFACAISRVVVLLVLTSTSTDQTWNVVSFEVLNVVELNLAILCASTVPVFSKFKMMLNKKDQGEYPAHEMLCHMPRRLDSSSTQYLERGDSASHYEVRDDRRWNSSRGKRIVPW